MGWNLSVMMIGWSGSPGRCRCGCWRSGLRAGLSAAMARRGFDPVHDRGQVLIDLALTQILGGEAISDFQGLRHLAPVIGPVPSTPTVWRALSEAGELQLSRLNAAVTSFRRHWWALLAVRPQGFPWLRVAGRELTGVTVVDLDASIVFAASEKENAQPTYKGGVGFCPNLATCDNTDDMLAIDPRPGGATSNCAKDNIALLDLAVSLLPSRYRRRVLVRLDGAGFSHDLLEHIAASGGVKGRQWERATRRPPSGQPRVGTATRRGQRPRSPAPRRQAYRCDHAARPRGQPASRHGHHGLVQQHHDHALPAPHTRPPARHRSPGRRPALGARRDQRWR